LTEECISRARRDRSPVIALHSSQFMTVALSLYVRMGFELLRDGAACVWRANDRLPYALARLGLFARQAAHPGSMPWARITGAAIGPLRKVSNASAASTTWDVALAAPAKG